MAEDSDKPLKKADLGWMKQFATLTKSAVDAANSATKFPLHLASALALTSDQMGLIPDSSIKLMKETGSYIRELRHVAGITKNELSEAMDLEDQSLMAAVEAGTATLSFDLILRLASVLARHDPIPTALRFARTYNPELWQVLDNWGISGLPLKVERERQFINILRVKDNARDLSEEQFNDLLKFTESAFELALNFIDKAPDTGSQKTDTKKPSSDPGSDSNPSS